MSRRLRKVAVIAPVADPTIAAIARRIATQAPREPDRGVSRFVQQIARDVAKSHRQIGVAVDQWHALVPAELATRSRLDAIRAGVLHVVVDDSSTLWTLDRLLRGGLELQLIAAIGASVRAVRLRVGPTAPNAPDRSR